MLGIAPKEVLFNRIKYGFNTPISKILNDNSSNSPCSILLDETTNDRGLFDMTTLKNIVNLHQSGKPGYSLLLFRLLNTELWFREFMD